MENKIKRNEKKIIFNFCIFSVDHFEKCPHSNLVINHADNAKMYVVWIFITKYIHVILAKYNDGTHAGGIYNSNVMM